MEWVFITRVLKINKNSGVTISITKKKYIFRILNLDQENKIRIICTTSTKE